MIVLYRYKFAEIKEVAKKALQWNVIANSVIIMIFKAFLDYTGVVETIPKAISGLPIPMFLAFALIFFVGTIISGSQAIIAMCIPMVMSASPDGVSLPMMMLVMTSAYAGMQLSPTHVCLAMVTDYFHTDMGALMKKTAPMLVLILAGMLGYYLILTTIL